jgi:DnaA-homolog protein
MTRSTVEQLAIAFPFEPRFTLETFVPGENSELTNRLATWHEDGTTPVVWVHGERRSGRTHLLHAVCTAFDRRGQRAAYVPRRFIAGAPESLRGLDAFALVALDDLDAWTGKREPEEALFALHRSLTTAGGKLLVASLAPPSGTAFALPDLGSRLRAGFVHALRPLDDTAKGRVVANLASQRGLEMPEDVLRYLFARGPRDMDGLLAAIDALDHAALVGQRRLTLPLARQVLGF